MVEAGIPLTTEPNMLMEPNKERSDKLDHDIEFNTVVNRAADYSKPSNSVAGRFLRSSSGSHNTLSSTLLPITKRLIVPSHFLNHRPSLSPISILGPSSVSWISGTVPGTASSGTCAHRLSAYALPPTAQQPPPRGCKCWNNHVHG